MEKLTLTTALLYVTTVASASVVAFFSYKKENEATDRYGNLVIQKASISSFGMCISFFILWQLLAFSTCGTDTQTYNDLFVNAKDFSYTIGYHQIEKGFALLNFAIRLVTDNEILYNCVIAFIFLLLVFKTLYKFREKIHFGWGILVFATTFYLQYMNLKRIYLAVAICFYAVSFMYERMYIKATIIIIIAMMIHTSAIIMFVPLLIDVFLSKAIKWRDLFFCAGTVLLLCFALRNQIAGISLSSRYTQYGMEEAGLGILQFAYHIPILYILIKQLKNDEDRIYIQSLVLILCSFIISVMGYYVAMVGRMFVYYMLPFMVAASTGNIQRKISSLRDYSEFKNFVMLMYFAVRLCIYLVDMSVVDGIYEYSNIFGMIF